MTYSDLPGVNFSTLKAIAKSPLHYVAALQKKYDADHFRQGRAMHTLLLEPAKYLTEYVVWTGKVRNGKEWDAFKAAHAGKTILTTTMATNAERMAAALERHPFVRELMAGDARLEQVVQWTDPVTGIACKGRRDLVGGGTLVDFKHTARMDYYAVQRSIATLDYHTQCSWYASPPDVQIDRHLLIFVEGDDAVDVGIFELDPEAIAVGARRWRAWLDLLQTCRESGKWPGRYPDVTPINIPDYAIDVDDQLILEDE